MLFVKIVEVCGVLEMFSGGYSVWVTPGHMPNPEVKPDSADGTMWGTHGRVSSCQKTVRPTKAVRGKRKLYTPHRLLVGETSPVASVVSKTINHRIHGKTRKKQKNIKKN